jgi:hypothetical protein
MGALVVSFISGAIGGIFTWLAAEYFTRQVARFNELRLQIAEEMFFVANIDRNPKNDSDKAALNDAVTRFRRLGMQLQALNATLSGTSRYYLRQRGFDPLKAGQGIIGLSNTLPCADPKLDQDYAITRHDVEKSLRLVQTYTDKQIEKIRSEVERRHMQT